MNQHSYARGIMQLAKPDPVLRDPVLRIANQHSYARGIMQLAKPDPVFVFGPKELARSNRDRAG